MNIKKKILSTLLAAYIGLAAPIVARASKGQAEVLAGHKSTTIDLRIAGDLGGRFALFSRNRINTDYNNKVGTFNLLNIGYKLGDKVQAIFQTRYLSQTGFTPRIGAQYLSKTKNLSALGVATVNLNENTNLEAQIILTYTPKLSKNLKGMLELESINHIGKDSNGKKGYKPIIRTRVGVDYKGYRGGVAADYVKPKHTKKFKYNIGLFIRKSF